MEEIFIKNLILLEKKIIYNFCFDYKKQIFIKNIKIKKSYIFPGSFNPLTHGHILMMNEIIKKKEKKLFFFEISIKNPDKKIKKRNLYYKRFLQFLDRDLNLIISNKGLFVDKLEYLEDTDFLIGGDTLKRILDVKYYHNSEKNLEICLDKFINKRCGFLTFARYDTELKKYLDLKEVFLICKLKKEHLKKWEKVITEIIDFRVDISSTEVRNKLKENKIDDLLTN